MRIRPSLFLPMIVAAALLPGLAHPLGLVDAASTVRHAATARQVPLIVTITTTNRVARGRVNIDYFAAGKRVYKACARARCRFLVPQGSNVFFHQVALDPRHWKFTYWTLTRLGAEPQSYVMVQPSTGLRIQASYRISAQYVRLRR